MAISPQQSNDFVPARAAFVSFPGGRPVGMIAEADRECGRSVQFSIYSCNSEVGPVRLHPSELAWARPRGAERFGFGPFMVSVRLCS